MMDWAPLITAWQNTMGTVTIVFLRIASLMAILPGFGEHSIPMRIKVGLAIALTLIAYPMVELGAHAIQNLSSFIYYLASEVITGLFIGLLLRLMVLALQTAGSIAAQSTSLSQILGNTGAEPMPAMGHFLTTGGLALLMIMGFHVQLISMIFMSYDLFPAGHIISPATLMSLGINHVNFVFFLAFGIAAPFCISALLYNVTLGAINKAMPQLMVAFVGAPAITFFGLFLLYICAPYMLKTWADAVHKILEFSQGSGF